MRQKNKSSIVLLITLFFITSISILILKNLQDHEQYISESTLETTLIQVQISSKNIENEVKSLVQKYNNNIPEIIDITSNGIPFDYGDVKLNIMLNYYDVEKCNLNDINLTLSIYEQCDNNIVDNILYPYDFIELLRDYKNKYQRFNSQAQIDYFIQDYKYQNRDESIDTIKHHFSFLKMEENLTYLQCNYEMLINSNTINGSFVFNNNDSNISQFTITIN